MVQEEVKARKVGDSIVITLSRPILAETGIGVGEMLVAELPSTFCFLLAKESRWTHNICQLCYARRL